MVSLLGESLTTILLVAGLILTVLEGFAPGAHFIVIGVALLAAGILGLLVPGAARARGPGPPVLVGGAGSFYLYRHFEFYTGSDRGQTEGSADLVGEQGYVIERVTPRSGQVKLESGGFDPTYAARSVEGIIEEGTPIIVIDPGGGNVLKVDAIAQQDEIDRELERGANRKETTEKSAETEEEAGRG